MPVPLTWLRGRGNSEQWCLKARQLEVDAHGEGGRMTVARSDAIAMEWGFKETSFEAAIRRTGAARGAAAQSPSLWQRFKFFQEMAKDLKLCNVQCKT